MKKQGKNPVADKNNGTVNRRQFIAGAGAAALSFSVIKPGFVKGADANSKIKVGLIGCGERGIWIIDFFKQHGGFEVVAGADYFQDRVDAFGDKFGIPANRRYTTLSCYKKLLESDVDAVVIESPPYFHPEQAAAAIDAGKHVYIAKPIAIDVPGCQTIAKSGKKATQNKLCLLVDFQTRSNPVFKEAIKRVKYGDIGDVISGVASYDSGGLRLKAEQNDKPETYLRNWQNISTYSGDNVVEGNIHMIDVACWIFDADPVKAYGAGGRKTRTEPLPYDNWDHISSTVIFPNNAPLSFTGTEYPSGHGTMHCHVFGEYGTIDTNYFGNVGISGRNPYAGGSTGSIYDQSVVNNVATFYDSITKGKFHNPTVDPSVRSNMTSVLIRDAARKGGELTWKQFVKDNEKLTPPLKGLKS